VQAQPQVPQWVKHFMGTVVGLLHGVVHQVLPQCVWYALVAVLAPKVLLHLVMEVVPAEAWVGKTISQ
jgi:hypothetical protein